MVVSRHGDHFFGALLADHVFVKFFLDLVRRRNIIDREYGLGTVLLFLLHLRLLAASETAAENVSQVQETDGRPAAVSAALGCPRVLIIVLLLYHFRFLRLFALYNFAGNRFLSFLF